MRVDLASLSVMLEISAKDNWLIILPMIDAEFDAFLGSLKAAYDAAQCCK
jgi:hypothetical protein